MKKSFYDQIRKFTESMIKKAGLRICNNFKKNINNLMVNMETL